MSVSPSLSFPAPPSAVSKAAKEAQEILASWLFLELCALQKRPRLSLCVCVCGRGWPYGFSQSWEGAYGLGFLFILADGDSRSGLPLVIMDSIIIQERLVERLLSPRTQTQRSHSAKLKDHEKQYVGFATLPNQVHRKSVKKGFDFTLMVAGESGLGKSTLVNSLFLTDLYKDRKLLNAEERISQTVEIVKHTVDIEEKGVKLKLTIVDTPGFGDAVNNTECWKPITDYIDQQFEQYFRDESGLNRKNIQDNRVHCCLYFISPFGHGLRPVDVEFMKALHEKVNIVPLIAKADCLIPAEIKKLKERIREEIDKFGIKVYQFPECDSDEDEDFKQQDRELKESAPFAVIGSNTVVEAKGQRVRGRLYPWGIVEVENQAHCDFVKLRNMLIRTHMHDLKDVTCDVQYENYRAQCIQQMTSKLTQDNRIESPIPILPLPTPDAETEKLIKMKDEELRRMQEMLQKMQQQMQDQ
ncbi:septin-5 isoform X1 [Elgaria multicarinata webbii]|uniref:septin-5 isoform X1 n=1 Tax=Elgaria multicarinata webbii TaxID=159646 RepID=UPI002FCD0E17